MRIVRDYYADFFSSSRPSIAIDDVVYVDKRLSHSMRDLIEIPFTKDEVIISLQGMHPGKSPGPDGFPVMFYNKSGI